MADLPRVALLIDMSGVYCREILRGIARYGKSHRPWSMFLDWQESQSVRPGFRRAHWDGVICRSAERKLVAALRRRKIPAVCVGQHSSQPGGLPRVWSDNPAIGQMGAAHLLEREFRQFAFCGYRGEAWAEGRRDGFVAAIRQAGYPCALYESAWTGNQVSDCSTEQARIARWIGKLPKPLALMACNDVCAQQVLNACRAADTTVPEQVAVLGVDNDEVLCDLCDPPLSSIALNPEQIGYEAAELLEHLMQGGERPAEPRWIGPREVVLRQSSDVLGIEDPKINAAARFIRQNACQGVTVDDVTAHLGLSRSTLERRFRECLGHSPHDQILVAQVKRVQQLLADTNLPLEAIAVLLGYEHPEYLGVVFKRITGLTPGTYRQEAQGKPIAHVTTPRHRRSTASLRRPMVAELPSICGSSDSGPE